MQGSLIALFRAKDGAIWELDTASAVGMVDVEGFSTSVSTLRASVFGAELKAVRVMAPLACAWASGSRTGPRVGEMASFLEGAAAWPGPSEILSAFLFRAGCAGWAGVGLEDGEGPLRAFVGGALGVAAAPVLWC
jgi:hypothetical protein